MKILFDNFGMLADAPNGIERLRKLILSLAMQGKLVRQDPSDGKTEDLLEQLKAEKKRLTGPSNHRKGRTLLPVTEDEKQFKVPCEWDWVRLDDVGFWGSGSTPNRKRPEYYGGEFLWFKSGELNDNQNLTDSVEKITEKALEECTLRSNQPGDVLIAMYGATVGRLAILGVSATTNQAVCACSCLSGIDNRFLFYLLKSYRQKLIDKGAGAAQPNISKIKITNTAVPLPPFGEQKRIVAKVDKLMAVCDKLEEQKKKRDRKRLALNRSMLHGLLSAREPDEFDEHWQRIVQNFDLLYDIPETVGDLKKAILQLAVQGKLVKQDPNDESADVVFRKIKKADSSKNEGFETGCVPFNLPPNWKWCKFTDVFFPISQSKKRLKTKQYMSRGKYPIIDQGLKKIAGYTDFSDRLIKLKRPVVVFGDHTKAVKYVDFDFVPGADGTKILNPIEPLDSRYFYWATNAYDLPDRGYARHFKVLKQQLFPLPPVREQEKIVVKVDKLMALCNRLEEQLNEKRHMKTRLRDSIVSAVGKPR